MKQLLYILILALIFVGCEPRLKPQKPDNLIAKDKMVEVLYDMFIVTAAKGINRKKFEARKINPETYILQKHNIDSTQFAQSNNYYAHDIETYKAIVEEVKAKLSVEKERYVAIDAKVQEEKKLVRDSIRAVKIKQRANPNLKELVKPKKVN